ncbi:hypothetical protein E2562_003642 [Oryza meyeriana var. granulata]|uniref:AP2/ERF domain-containing protein n=1 Tax=Oryza meyeriana var. granulata TaxID=110450 RepID=A0A6G1C465_9ORYZ|nr:hypothetical protein E2562_003642 [Oryza meyeriana var. granulata]
MRGGEVPRRAATKIREPNMRMRLWFGSFATTEETAQRLYGPNAFLNLPPSAPPPSPCNDAAVVGFGTNKPQLDLKEFL